MKKFFCLFAAALVAASLFALPASAAVEVEKGYDYGRFKGQNVTLNVFNWGEYISNGGDGSMDVIHEFEELTGIKVQYNMFASNEEMYTKIKSGGADYDVIIPSDYMIGKMVQEGLLAKLNYTNIPNEKFIGQAYKGLAYDPTDEYSVPYMWGTVGLIYNTTMVDEPVDSWSILWDEKYAGDILMFNNSRDAFAIASRLLGKSMNPTTTDEVKEAAQKLKEQKGVVQAYVMDEIFDKMEGGEAAVAPYYAGDAITMIRENPDLAFAFPKEGTNYFVDAMCIPATSKNKEAAEMFINFMCETQVSLANAEYIGYSTPQTESVKLLPDEIKNSPIAYPSEEVLANTETFTVLSDEVNTVMDSAWSDIRSYDEKGSKMLVPVLLAVAVAAIICIFWRRSVKRKRNDY